MTKLVANNTKRPREDQTLIGDLNLESLAAQNSSSSSSDALLRILQNHLENTHRVHTVEWARESKKLNGSNYQSHSTLEEVTDFRGHTMSHSTGPKQKWMFMMRLSCSSVIKHCVSLQWPGDSPGYNVFRTSLCFGSRPRFLLIFSAAAPFPRSISSRWCGSASIRLLKQTEACKRLHSAA